MGRHSRNNHSRLYGALLDGGRMSIIDISGNEAHLDHEQAKECRDMIEMWLRGRIHAANYNFERKTLDNGRVTVHAEIHLEVSPTE